MKEFKAYCRFCHENKGGKVVSKSKLDSGNYLYVGNCELCEREIRRIVTPDQHNTYIDKIDINLDKYTERLSYMEENGV